MMKFVLIALVVLAVVWWLRRPARRDAPPPAPPATDGAAEVVACAHCGLHVPRHEALPGPAGVFCSEDHRQAAARGDGAGR